MEAVPYAEDGEAGSTESSVRVPGSPKFGSRTCQTKMWIWFIDVLCQCGLVLRVGRSRTSVSRGKFIVLAAHQHVLANSKWRGWVCEGQNVFSLGAVVRLVKGGVVVRYYRLSGKPIVLYYRFSDTTNCPVQPIVRDYRFSDTTNCPVQPIVRYYRLSGTFNLCVCI